MGKTNKEGLKRWQHNRFGMFIHWGLYALAGRHEWVKHYESITDEDYQKYFDYFNPDRYDPKEWACYAKKAGMKYVVLTTKHHEGFCLWDTKQTDYKSTNTPYGKDLLTPFVDAFRNEGIRIGLYHSLIDWHHPHYTMDRLHPMRDNSEFKAGNEKRDMNIYADYLHAQVRELLTDFGEIDMIFFDFSIRDDKPGVWQKGRDAWKSEKLVDLVRSLQPNILINDRLELEEVDGGWDYKTPEQCMLRKALRDKNGQLIPWETCQTFSGSWGYYRDEYTWKSVDQLLKLLIDTVSKGGNLLLNVGPTARGEFDTRAQESLNGMGDWMELHSRSIYGCTEVPEEFKTPIDCRLTYNPETNRIYIHVFSWPPTGELCLDGFNDKIVYAQLLNDSSEVIFSSKKEWGKEDTDGDSLTSLKIPIKKPVEVPVIELFMKS